MKVCSTTTINPSIKDKMTNGTKQQIVTHNCTVEPDAPVCKKLIN